MTSRSRWGASRLVCGSLGEGLNAKTAPQSEFDLGGLANGILDKHDKKEKSALPRAQNA
jgi:hypothetical protein